MSLRFAIVGAGMAGILAAIKLEEAGFSDVVVYEKADRLGGTWRENTYPGIACDVPSHLYSYSFAPNPDWSRHYAPGAEIEAYLERIAAERGVAGRVRLGEEVTRAEHVGGEWRLETARGGRAVADVVIAATGVLHHPRYPELPGLETFAGACFHSARWNHDVAVDGWRVGIVGTGSTAVQMVSALVDRVAKLALFQRTAQWIMPQENPAYVEDEKAEWRRSPEKIAALRAEISQVFAEHFANAVVDATSPQMRFIEDVCRTNLETSVADPALRERLRPSYHAACKRLVLSPDFYQAIQRPNAQLVTDAIERIEPAGVLTADGTLHELDVLVLATGFRVDRFMRPMAIVGRGGIALDDVWAARPSAYLSISIPDFPNLFMLNGPNGPVGNFSLIEVAELQFAYVLQLVELIRSGRCRELSATAAATERFEAERVVAARKTVWMTGCRSWYLDDRGIPAAWPWSFDRFRAAMAAPDLADYELL